MGCGFTKHCAKLPVLGSECVRPWWTPRGRCPSRWTLPAARPGVLRPLCLLPPNHCSAPPATHPGWQRSALVGHRSHPVRNHSSAVPLVTRFGLEAFAAGNHQDLIRRPRPKALPGEKSPGEEAGEQTEPQSAQVDRGGVFGAHATIIRSRVTSSRHQQTPATPSSPDLPPCRGCH